LGKLNYKIPKSKPWDRIDLELRWWKNNKIELLRQIFGCIWPIV
jgi:hypothetical protein